MASLRRTRVGAFRVSEAVPLDTLTEEPRRLSCSAGGGTGPPAGPGRLDDAEREDVWQGRSLPTEFADTPLVRVVDTDDELLALARAEAGRLHPFKVFQQDDCTKA